MPGSGFAALAAYLDDSASEEQRRAAAAALCQSLHAGDTTVVQVVVHLEEWCTSSDHLKRGMGTRALAEVVTGAPTVLLLEQLSLIVPFLGDRLADWSSTEPAARALTAILRRKQSNREIE
ncbi:hypothetical protein FOA52_008533 [Chlamydomonas sp. UWO 241]|nr:hypothetical protein FOA52_008533 [Chlamydomonas sp. UWO 241]